MEEAGESLFRFLCVFSLRLGLKLMFQKFNSETLKPGYSLRLQKCIFCFLSESMLITTSGHLDWSREGGSWDWRIEDLES